MGATIHARKAGDSRSEDSLPRRLEGLGAKEQ